MKISFFKTAKPKEFKYTPLYYNERKEELEKIRKSVEAKEGDDQVERMRVNLERSWRTRRDRQQRKAPVSSVRLLLYLAAIALFIYLMFFYKGF
ncbi:MAG: hypothetical protein IH597_02000 [Bacteroidales bacterium]|nr:hypothetical protein [Bacteroidales bacterium]